MPSTLEIRHIAKKYNQQSILHDLNFSVDSGEIFGLLGESGSGKSTLLRIAAGLIDPDEGQVWLDGKPLLLASDQLIPGHADIKIVHQDYHLSAPLTVRENINYALRYYEKAYRDERVDELIQLCHLEAVAYHPVKQLSGGEKQRTAIAKALAEEARVLLLDEPFAHLDLPNRRRLMQTVRDLATESNLACIFVTHEATDALALSHRMGILRQGHLLQSGRPQSIYNQPIDDYVASLTGEINLIEKFFFERYFTEMIPKIVFGRQVMIRPEQFTIEEQQKPQTIEAKVIKSIFEGSRYRIYFEVENVVLLAYHRHFFPERQSIFISTNLLYISS